MEDERIDYEQLRFRVEQKIQREKRQVRIGLLVPNIILFVLFMLVAWVLVPRTAGLVLSDDMLALVLILSIGWATGLLLQTVGFYMETDAYKRRLSKRYMAQEVADEMARLDSYEVAKPKRGRLELGEDGELIEIVDEDEEKLKRSEV
jgi:hypothetical protein